MKNNGKSPETKRNVGELFVISSVPARFLCETLREGPWDRTSSSVLQPLYHSQVNKILIFRTLNGCPTCDLNTLFNRPLALYAG